MSRRQKLSVLMFAWSFCQCLFPQTNAATTGVDARLGAALREFYGRCGSVDMGADPDRRFAYWTDAEIASGEPTGWREYRVKDRPWDLWNGSFEGADLFKETSGLLVEMWAGSDSDDWGTSTYYCFGPDGKTRSIFMRNGQVPEAQIAFLEQQVDAHGHFKVTRRECYATDVKYFGNCKETQRGLSKEIRQYSSEKQLPFASLLPLGK